MDQCVIRRGRFGQFTPWLACLVEGEVVTQPMYDNRRIVKYPTLGKPHPLTVDLTFEVEEAQ